ncbi:class I SAM-dependent methyltransferase [Niabella aquatica]
MGDINIWNKIPLNDYEQHMQHHDVGQSQLLNSLTRKYLHKHNPERLLFLGVSGGNGLEHVDIMKAKSVCGIDINQAYIEETRKRYGNRIEQLILINADINTSDETFVAADFVWGALILEYVDIEHCFKFLQKNTVRGAILVITIQSNNGVTSVSNTGIASLNLVEDIFKVVDKEDLIRTALKFGFDLIGCEENILPNGKSFFTLEFIKKEVTGVCIVLSNY